MGCISAMRSLGVIVNPVTKNPAFSQFISHLQNADGNDPVCCGTDYTNTRDLYRHVNSTHNADIGSATEHILAEGSLDAKWKLLQKKGGDTTDARVDGNVSMMPHQFSSADDLPWLPVVDNERISSNGGQSRILLFYNYRYIPDTKHVREWQEILCERLQLTGKIRVAVEGLNGTVAGSVSATDIYMAAVMNHPLFSSMSRQQFKTSEGIEGAFPDGLRVTVHEEACPMGIRPDQVSHTDAGVHLTPEQFHNAVNGLSASEAILVDCRNYYESKIGRFDGAVAPSIRKFSYWPEYVDKNPELFRGKDVYMYCTGGIRCERGSAYVKQQGLCREVYQLEGGIHKYAEQYPDGLFKGKLFVFDNRYAIPVNDNILSGWSSRKSPEIKEEEKSTSHQMWALRHYIIDECVYCGEPWDSYEPCSSSHCHQLVLSCPTCRDQQHTTCCAPCLRNHELTLLTEECDCTRNRGRVAPPKMHRGQSMNQLEDEDS